MTWKSEAVGSVADQVGGKRRNEGSERRWPREGRSIGEESRLKRELLEVESWRETGVRKVSIL